MDSDIPNRLIIIKQSRGTDQWYAHVAKLEAGMNKIVFDKAIELIFNKTQMPFSRGALAYNPQDNELIYACWTMSSPKEKWIDGEKLIRIWHIGPYLTLTNPEETTLRHSWYTRGISLSLEGKVINVAASVSPRDEKSDNVPTISRKDGDGKWRSMPIRTIQGLSNGASSIIVNRLAADQKYVHTVSWEHTDLAADQLDLYSIRHEPTFANAATDNSIIWQHYKVSTGINMTGGTATVIVPDEKNKRKRLYFFTTGAHQDQDKDLLFTYITLRNDGSVDSYEQNIKCPQWTAIPMNAEVGGLCPGTAHFWNKKVVFLAGLFQSYAICMGDVAEDGSLPAGDQWRHFPTEFKKPIYYSHTTDGGAAFVGTEFID